MQLHDDEAKVLDLFVSKLNTSQNVNHLSDLSFIKDIKNSIVSADIAGKIKFDHDILKYIDYLFVSDEDIVAFVAYANDLFQDVTTAVGTVAGAVHGGGSGGAGVGAAHGGGSGHGGGSAADE